MMGLMTTAFLLIENHATMRCPMRKKSKYQGVGVISSRCISVTFIGAGIIRLDLVRGECVAEAGVFPPVAMSCSSHCYGTAQEPRRARWYRQVCAQDFADKNAKNGILVLPNGKWLIAVNGPLQIMYLKALTLDAQHICMTQRVKDFPRYFK
jgi:hypothetical protein